MIDYLIMLILSGIAVILMAIGIVLILVDIIKKRADEETKIGFLFMIPLLFLFILFFVYYAVDIPSAMNGGKVMYTNELLTLVCGVRTTHIISDKEELKDLKGFNPNNYEKYGNYLVRYTKHNKYVLKIEKIE